jgi:hypoxanthine phosphoribosyltransferase
VIDPVGEEPGSEPASPALGAKGVTADAHADVGARTGEPAFAHASEAEMARILDFYAVRWEYEPHRFPILWNLDGTVVESFSPDFYLPDLDLYLEMTTLRQRLVRKKNRKLRRLRELYPDVRIKLFYARDFRALMLKFGRLALVDGLSGTPGQVTPARNDLELAIDRLPHPALADDLEPKPEPVGSDAVPLTPAAMAALPVTPTAVASAAAPAGSPGAGRTARSRRRARRRARAERSGETR